MIFRYIALLTIAFTFHFQSKAQTFTNDKNCKVVINFNSAGGGIDVKKYETIKKMITEQKLKYKENVFGQEGETEICLPLKELKKNKKTDFIERLKKEASSGQFISLSVN